MTKKVVSKKVIAPVEVAPVEAPASEPVQAEAVNPTPASAPVLAADRRARAGRAADAQGDDPRAKWKRRLGRWAGKVEVAGLDPRALMTEYLDKA